MSIEQKNNVVPTLATTVVLSMDLTWDVVDAGGVVLGSFSFEGRACAAAASLATSIRRAHLVVPGRCDFESAYGYGGPTLYCNGLVHHGEDCCREHALEHGVSVRPYPVALGLIMDGWDSYDLYASAASLAFALGDLATAAGIEGVHAALDYSPGAGEAWTMDDLLDEEGAREGSFQMESFDLARAYQGGAIDDGDVLLAARVISRYLDVLRAAGLEA